MPSPAHETRCRQRALFTLKRKYADVTAQIEGALCEARALAGWKYSNRPTKLARLEEADRRMLQATRAKRLGEAANKACLNSVIKPVMAHKYAFPFNTPVDTAKYADYSKYVATPMDFGSIKAKMEAGGYAEPAEAYADALLVFNNARTYNQPTEDVHHMATQLQELFHEKWLKHMLPRLQEDSKMCRIEEDSLRARKATLLKQRQELAAQDAACRLVAQLDELHEQLGKLRVQAALACEPMDAAGRAELAAALDALPLKQLEAALGLVLPRLAADLPASAGDQQGTVEIDLDLASCSALELRQLQSFAAGCKAANEQRLQQQAAAAAAEPQAAQAAAERDAKPGTPGPAATASSDAAGGCPCPGPGSAAAAAAGAAAAAAAAGAAAGSQGRGRGAGGRHEMSGFPVLFVHDTSLSERAGITWPGLVLGAGLKSRSRLLLPGQVDEPPPMPALPLPPPPLLNKAALQAAGKRRSSDTGGTTARPPLPPTARPSRLAGGHAAAGATLGSPFAAAASHNDATPGRQRQPHEAAQQSQQATPQHAAGEDSEAFVDAQEGSEPGE